MPKVVKITKPAKSWWPGDERVEKFMPPVAEAIKRHVEWPSDAYTDIYNRAYEAVFAALEGQLTPNAVDALPDSVCPYCHEKYTGTYGDHVLQKAERH